jgi:NAD(P)-dependent dehydrogenase (short-subunit alcohol dehydrogenase family)
MKEAIMDEPMKNVLITGGASGLGKSVVGYFAARGFRVFSCDIKKVPHGQMNVIPVTLDVRNSKSLEAAMKTVRKHTGRLDAVINLAGIYNMDSLVEIGEKEFTGIFDVNFTGVYRVNRVFHPLLFPGGRIIVVTSEVAVLKPLPFNGLYSITKTALEAYAHSLRYELALVGIPSNFNAVMRRVTGKAMEPSRLAELIFRAATAKHYRYIYTINANPLLKIADLVPIRLMIASLKLLLNRRGGKNK